MSLVWLDGFETYGASGANGTTLSTEVARRYPAYSLPVASTPYAELAAGWGGGLGIKGCRSSVAHYIAPTFAHSLTWVVGCAIQLPASLRRSSIFVVCNRTTPFAKQVMLSIQHDGTLSVYRGDFSALLGTSKVALRPSAWYYIEFKVYCHDTAGTAEVHVNGLEVLNLTGKDTLSLASTDIGRIEISAPRAALDAVAAGMLDDLYIQSGGSFLGPNKVEVLRPTSDTVTIDWTPSTGTDHFALVDENPVNSSDYVASTTTNNADLYNIADLSVITDNIVGVQLGGAGCLDVAGTENLLLSCNSNGTGDDGSAFPLTGTSVLVYNRILETDPNTSAAWTISAVNALTAGVKVG